MGTSKSKSFLKKRGEDLIIPIVLSLDELYLGLSARVILKRNVICSQCNGEGFIPGAHKRCTDCKGSGMTKTINHIGPSSQPFVYQPCDECEGSGEVVDPQCLCEQCEGERVVPEPKALSVVVDKGMYTGQKIIVPGQAHEVPETVTGDAVFVILQREHPEFTRIGDDLFYEHTITLTEALTGFHFVLTHLDGRRILMESDLGQVVRPNSYMEINDEGMPVPDSPSTNGTLFIHFNVVFPTLLVQRPVLVLNHNLDNEYRAAETGTRSQPRCTR